MKKVTTYLLSKIRYNFFILFFTLFSISSIIFFIRISRITSVIQINFFELIQLYLFLLPNILIYTIPETFFIALVVTLSNMSKENELIVLFSLNYKPKYLVKLFFFLSALVTALLLVVSLVLTPIAKQKYKQFVHYKKIEAKLNIKPNKFGQKFSNWMVFITKANKQNYENIVLFNQNKKDVENFIIAKKAFFNNNEGSLNFKLKNGKAFFIKENKMQQINYDSMDILYNIDVNDFKVNSVLEYWKKKDVDKSIKKRFNFFILISFFPLATFLLAISIGIINYRYEKRNIYLHIFVVIFSYYAIAFFMQNSSNLPLVISVPFIILVLSYFVYKKVVERKY